MARSSLKVASWNINGIRPRIDHVCRFLDGFAPDVLCLQEIKCLDSQFPANSLTSLGYVHVAVAGQKGYHGVATVSRIPFAEIERLRLDDTGEARHLAVTLKAQKTGPLVIHNFYVPSGGDVPDSRLNPKFDQKLAYLRSMRDWSAARARPNDQSILVGDLNVAPLETDVWSHRQLLNVVSHTPIEVAHLEEVRQAHPWTDIMRRFVPPEQSLYTWWSYRARNWRASNRGRRLDHIWATPRLADRARFMQVIDETRDWPRPSDHVPVIAGFDV